VDGSPTLNSPLKFYDLLRKTFTFTRPNVLTLNHHFFMGFYCDLRNVIRKPSCIGTMETQGSFKPRFERYSQTKLYDKYGNLVTILH